jgi:hypothetical protein
MEIISENDVQQWENRKKGLKRYRFEVIRKIYPRFTIQNMQKSFNSYKHSRRKFQRR